MIDADGDARWLMTDADARWLMTDADADSMLMLMPDG